MPQLRERAPTEEELRAVGIMPQLRERAPTEEELRAVGIMPQLQERAPTKEEASAAGIMPQGLTEAEEPSVSDSEKIKAFLRMINPAVSLPLRASSLLIPTETKQRAAKRVLEDPRVVDFGRRFREEVEEPLLDIGPTARKVGKDLRELAVQKMLRPAVPLLYSAISPQRTPQDQRVLSDSDARTPAQAAVGTFIEGFTGDIGEKVLTPLTSPLNIGLVLSSLFAPPLISRVFAGLFSAVQLKDAYKAVKEGDWQQAALSLGFSGLAAAGAANKTGVSSSVLWKKDFVSKGMSNKQATQAAEIMVVKGKQPPVEAPAAASTPSLAAVEAVSQKPFETPPPIRAGGKTKLERQLAKAIADTEKLQATPEARKQIQAEINKKLMEIQRVKDKQEQARAEAAYTVEESRLALPKDRSELDFSKKMEQQGRQRLQREELWRKTTGEKIADPEILAPLNIEGQYIADRTRLFKEREQARSEAPFKAPPDRYKLDPRILTDSYTRMATRLWDAVGNLKRSAIDGSGLGKYLLERYNQPPEYVALSKAREAEIGYGRSRGTELGERLASPKLSTGEKEILGRIMRNEATVADMAKIKNNPNTMDALEAAKQARAEIYSLGNMAVQQKLLTEKVFALTRGKYLPRLYKKWEVPYETVMNQYGANLITPQTGIKAKGQQRFMQRKNIPEQTRRAMGEILEPGYPVSRALSDVTFAVETTKLSNAIAKHKVGAKGVELGKEWVLTPDQYKTLNAKELALWSETAVPKSELFGELSGKHVLKGIFEDLNQVMLPSKSYKKIRRILLSEFKFNKVVANPPTHIRNIFSNAVLNQLGGLPATRFDIYWRAIKEMKRKGEPYRQAESVGLIGGAGKTFAEAEVGALTNSWLRSSGTGMERFMEVGQNLRKFRGRLSKTKIGEKLGKLYRLEEEWFKLAKFIHNKQKGMNSKAAALDAEKWLFNYGEVNPLVDWARTHPLGSPFITFTYKAVPAFLESLVTAPWRVATIAFLLNEINGFSASLLNMTEEEQMKELAILPDPMVSDNLFDVPSAMLLPFSASFIDEAPERVRPFLKKFLDSDFTFRDGERLYLNLSYFNPLGSVFEERGTPILKFLKGIPFASQLPLMGSPVAKFFAELLTGKDLFTDKSIIPAEATPLETAAVIAEKAVTAYVPPLFLGGHGWKNIRDAFTRKEDFYKDAPSIALTLLKNLGGIGIESINKGRQRRYRLGDFEKRREAVKYEYSRFLKSRPSSDAPPSQKAKWEKELPDRFKDFIGNLKKIDDEQIKMLNPEERSLPSIGIHPGRDLGSLVRGNISESR
jgi:hypothetical protein